MSNTLLAQAEAATTNCSAVNPSSSSPVRRPTLSRRRLSTSHTLKVPSRSACQPLSPSIAALDLSASTAAPVLASLRFQVLSYLADLEARLSQIEPPISAGVVKHKGESTVEEARAWANTALQMLENIRADVCSHLPDLHLESVSSATVEHFVKSHMPDVPNFDDVRAHLPAMPEAVRSRLPDIDIHDVRSRLDDVRSRFNDIDFHRPLDYIPTLSEHLRTLQAHLSSMDLPHSLSESVALLAPNTNLYDFIDNVLSSDFVAEISSDLRDGEDMIEKAAIEIAGAMRRSLNGSQLIRYADLPEKWRNNPFVARGYRFIPLHEWHRLLMSLFAWHNETVNIHTHFLPFLFWSLNLTPLAQYWAASVPENTELEPAVSAFSIFSLICLFTSSLWHTMSGCAHAKGMELCAQIDYVGIGWLISASIGTVVYYGFQCNPMVCQLFLALCVAMGVSGSVLPFMPWFNMPKYRGYRIAFFVTLALSAIAPLAYLSNLYSTMEMFAFIQPLMPSLLAYIAGLIFYATHFPECYVVRSGAPHWLDWFGGGSHAIWHVCVVLAISLHRSAMDEMKFGVQSADVCERQWVSLVTFWGWCR